MSTYNELTVEQQKRQDIIDRFSDAVNSEIHGNGEIPIFKSQQKKRATGIA